MLRASSAGPRDTWKDLIPGVPVKVLLDEVNK